MDNDKEEKDEFMMDMMETHHEEMVAAIKSIKIPEPKDNSDVVNRLNHLCDTLCKKLDNLPQPKVTVEKTEVNQGEVIGLLKNLISEIKTLNKEEKKEEKRNYTFDVIRDDYGNIKSVNVRQNG